MLLQFITSRPVYEGKKRIWAQGQLKEKKGERNLKRESSCILIGRFVLFRALVMCCTGCLNIDYKV